MVISDSESSSELQHTLMNCTVTELGQVRDCCFLATGCLANVVHAHMLHVITKNVIEMAAHMWWIIRSGIRALSLQNAAVVVPGTALCRLAGISRYVRINCCTGRLGVRCIFTAVFRYQRERTGQKRRPQRIARDREGNGLEVQLGK